MSDNDGIIYQGSGAVSKKVTHCPPLSSSPKGGTLMVGPSGVLIDTRPCAPCPVRCEVSHDVD